MKQRRFGLQAGIQFGGVSPWTPDQVRGDGFPCHSGLDPESRVAGLVRGLETAPTAVGGSLRLRASAVNRHSGLRAGTGVTAVGVMP